MGVGILELKNQWGMFPKCCNVRIGTFILRTVKQEILEMPQSRNYNGLAVPNFSLYHCHNIHSLSQFFVLLLHYTSPESALGTLPHKKT